MPRWMFPVILSALVAGVVAWLFATEQGEEVRRQLAKQGQLMLDQGGRDSSIKSAARSREAPRISSTVVVALLIRYPDSQVCEKVLPFLALASACGPL